jgi:hypothetical protein
MRYAARLDPLLGETQIDVESNCYTDALPLLRRILIRGQEVDLTSQGIALAAAILTAGQIGEQFEVSGLRVGSDYAEAIERVIGHRAIVANVDGLNRTISAGEIDLQCAPARDAAGMPAPERPSDATPLASITWSGDFVDRTVRRSSGFTLGDYHTNAGLFADAARVSIAISLIHARDRCRTLWVPAREEQMAGLAPVIEALSIVGVTLELVPYPGASEQRACRTQKGRHRPPLS